VDALLLEVLGGLDTLVGGSDLDQDSLLVNTKGLVKVNELVGLGNSTGLVEGELGVNLGGYSTGDDLEELLTETNEKSVHGVLSLLFLVTSLLLTELDGLGD